MEGVARTTTIYFARRVEDCEIARPYPRPTSRSAGATPAAETPSRVAESSSASFGGPAARERRARRSASEARREGGTRDGDRKKTDLI